MKRTVYFIFLCLVGFCGTKAFNFTGDPLLFQFFGVSEFDVSAHSDFYQRFGQSVAADGQTLVVGAPRALFDIGGTSALNALSTGKAFVYRYDSVLAGWGLEAVLYPAIADVSAEMNFGQAVGISGNVIAIGASSASKSGYASGCVFVFRLISGSWTQVQVIQPNDPSSEARFGQSVSIDREMLAVGSTDSDFLGAAYVFQEAAGVFSQEAKITASDRGNQSAVLEYRPQFGYSVSIDHQGLLLVGSPRYFEDLEPPGLYNYQGCHGSHDDCTAKGAAYMYRRELAVSPLTVTWVEDQRFSWKDTGYGYNSTTTYPRPVGYTPALRFGHSVALKGDLIVIGSPRMSTLLPNPFEPPSTFNTTANYADYSGRAFIYEGIIGWTSSSWTLAQVVNHADFWEGIYAETNSFWSFGPGYSNSNANWIREYFGTSVAIGGFQDNRFVAVGCPGNDDESLASRKNDSGAVYVFGKNNPLVVPPVPEPWPQFARWFGIPSASDTGTWLQLGTSVAATDEFFVSGKPLYNNSMGGVQIYM